MAIAAYQANFRQTDPQVIRTWVAFDGCDAWIDLDKDTHEIVDCTFNRDSKPAAEMKVEALRYLTNENMI